MVYLLYVGGVSTHFETWPSFFLVLITLVYAKITLKQGLTLKLGQKIVQLCDYSCCKNGVHWIKIAVSVSVKPNCVRDFSKVRWAPLKLLQVFWLGIEKTTWYLTGNNITLLLLSIFVCFTCVDGKRMLTLMLLIFYEFLNFFEVRWAPQEDVISIVCEACFVFNIKVLNLAPTNAKLLSLANKIGSLAHNN